MNNDKGQELLGVKELQQIIKAMDNTIKSDTSQIKITLDKLQKLTINFKDQINDLLKNYEEKEINEKKYQVLNLNEKQKEISLLALRFIYTFREFITQEQMIFSFTSNQTQKTVMVSFQKLLDEKKVQLVENGFFEIQGEIMNLRDAFKLEETQIEQDIVTLQEFQKKIIKLGTIESTYSGSWNKEVYEERAKKMGKDKCYPKKEPDVHVWVRFITPKDEKKYPRQKAYYYSLIRSNYYNKGWLNEWSASFYNTYKLQRQINNENFLNRDNIKALENIKFLFGIYKRDSEKGSLIGDFQIYKNEKRIQVQAKTRSNKHIINLKQVLSTLEKIDKLLEELKELEKNKSLSNLENKDSNSWQSIIELLYSSTNETYKQAIQLLSSQNIKLDNS